MILICFFFHRNGTFHINSLSIIVMGLSSFTHRLRVDSNIAKMRLLKRFHVQIPICPSFVHFQLNERALGSLNAHMSEFSHWQWDSLHDSLEFDTYEPNKKSCMEEGNGTPDFCILRPGG